MTEQTEQTPDWHALAAAIVNGLHNERKTNAKSFYDAQGSQRAQDMLRRLRELQRRLEPLVVAIHA